MVRRRAKGAKRTWAGGVSPSDFRRNAAAVLDHQGLTVDVPTVWCPDCRKHGFHTEEDAQKGLDALRARREVMNVTGKIERRHYPCPAGTRLHHLTSRE